MKTYLKFLSDQLLKSELLKSASVLITVSVIAQLISILLRPLLTRLYTPESFGICGILASGRPVIHASTRILMGQNGRKAFENKYTTKIAAERYKKLLNRVS